MIIIQRLIQAILTPLTGQDWRVVLMSLLVYGLVALPLGFLSRFLQFHPCLRSPGTVLSNIVKLFFFPALVEEIVFRVILIPHPLEAVSLKTWVFWMLFSLGLFIIYHPLNALIFYPEGNPTFWNSIFLILAGFLGLTCALVYRLTGSLWGIVIIHGLIVFVWLYFLDGINKLVRVNDSEL
ncbi:type II CAAX prenyl endopeptidase Rce1 family protein [Lyngbya sp. PCC 8106]|uniref:CPBP family glutamic-type intramembrane protease n=1 Tax=Lyngbya sp. (strain PCC 8106) TaxID=313612 RepID=UPI0005864DB1|nr:CPBP family glutamic-type intramembrane protease [Lyngbya sp. PCC 8106]